MKTSNIVLSALFASSTEAVKINAGSKLCQTGDCVAPLNCDYNLERLLKGDNDKEFNKYEGNGVLFNDTAFPAGESSLYWKKWPRASDSTMRETYDTMTAWRRPSEIVKDNAPSLFGSKGIRPVAI